MAQDEDLLPNQMESKKQGGVKRFEPCGVQSKGEGRPVSGIIMDRHRREMVNKKNEKKKDDRSVTPKKDSKNPQLGTNRQPRRICYRQKDSKPSGGGGEKQRGLEPEKKADENPMPKGPTI